MGVGIGVGFAKMEPMELMMEPIERMEPMMESMTEPTEPMEPMTESMTEPMEPMMEPWSR